MKNELPSQIHLDEQSSIQIFELPLASNVYKSVLAESNFQAISIRIFGKSYQVPRQVDYQGKYDYAYSNHTHLAKPFSPTISMLRQQVETICDFEFNSVLINYYRTGQDSMGYHRDNEAELDSTIIASLSLGGTRPFHIKHRVSKQRRTILLENNSLLIMKNCQEDWEHAIPKSKRYCKPRINLTFRRIKF